MHETPPNTLRETVERLAGELGRSERLEPVGVYLHGSIALGDFRAAHRDADIAVVLRGAPDPTARAALRAIHRDLARRTAWGTSSRSFAPSSIAR